ncbi:MAG: NAD(P)/FAD-dependent oxidoreductase [Methylibium sp.]|uniref:NAD(P)/FAD-dependent oxidoreductase n=1 Tax=Methylibium sp. TaxID=2067992 RepID=UPI00183ACD64|nr:NAD(P)/FAD-dependent oxidoreductase [Methylibium sp.]MBA3596176.1 NAD(P)/FAD-dependent oxidoreductase [Methylibium sp.]
MEQVDVIVVGAGVVGLAVARTLARGGLETLVLERERAIGTGISSRNSEVIHAGLYYPSGSLKARLCVAGRHALYDYCAERGVGHRRCGKLIVATAQAQCAPLLALERQGRANGVQDLQPLNRAQAMALEPQLECVAALLSPSTGIVDSHALMLSLQGDLERAGGVVALGTTVSSIVAGAPHVVQAGDMEIAARIVVNAAGLFAPALAGRIEGLAPAGRPVGRFAKGHYFSLAGRPPFSRLIYPLPQAAGLGVHLTLDLAGQVRFGPDVEWVEADAEGGLDYRVDARRAAGFETEIRRYWPALPAGALQPAYTGVRPKLQRPGEPAQDFRIDGPGEHGIGGLVNLFGIESPGLTACLALGEEVRARLER